MKVGLDGCGRSGIKTQASFKNYTGYVYLESSSKYVALLPVSCHGLSRDKHRLTYFGILFCAGGVVGADGP